MKKTLYFKNPERLERLAKENAIGQSEMVDLALQFYEQHNDVAHNSIRNAFNAICEGIVSLENIRDYHATDKFTEQMRLSHEILNKCFDLIQPYAQPNQPLED